MKRILTLAILAALAGCTKTNTPQAQPCRVTFNLSGITSGAITKGPVEDLLAAHGPGGTLSLKLTSLADPSRTYTATPGQEVAVIPDTYRVTGEYVPQTALSLFRGALYREPRFGVATQVTITEGVAQYSLAVTWNCFALVKDAAMVDALLIDNNTGTPTEIGAWTEDEGELSLVFVTCSSAWENDYYIRVTATPVDAILYQPTTWKLVTKPTAGCLQVRNGYWYKFTPEETQAQNGSFDFSFPSWTEGGTQ